MAAQIGDTRDRLVQAALAEFNEQGYVGTDSNKIARRAGHAPQTFYRWFPDKKHIFMAAYACWWQQEVSELSALLATRATPSVLAGQLVAHHRQHAGFRRSLRFLTTADDDVRTARAAGRQAQLQRLAALGHEESPATLAGRLFMLERWCDALVDGEFSDLGITEAEVMPMITQALAALLKA